MVRFWAFRGGLIAVSGLGGASADARLAVTVATVVGVAAALTGDEAFRRSRLWAGMALVAISLCLPVYYGWPLYLLPVAGLVLAAVHVWRRTYVVVQ